MTIKKRLAVTLGAVAATVAIGGVAMACQPGGVLASSNTRPGWGHGDKNHEHSGPPGQSVNPGHGHGHGHDDHGNGKGKGHDKHDD